MIKERDIVMGIPPDDEDIIFRLTSYRIVNPLFMPFKKVWEPNTDIFETSDAFVIKLEIAGMKSNNFNIIVHEEKLIIRGERKDSSNYVKDRYHQMEIPYGYFEKIFTFPFPMDSENVRASYRDGFLEVVIPKVEGRKIGEITINIEIAG